MVSVSSTVKVYEVDDKETKVPAPEIVVKSHWNRKQLVVIRVDGKDWTVSADDLDAAIRNATNTGR